MTWFDGTDFEGPIEIADLPHEPGVYLITTDASGGVKIIGAYEAEDMGRSASENPKRLCWTKNRKDTDPVAYYLLEKEKDAREKLVLNVMLRRPYDLVCNDPIRDDF